MSPYVPLFPRTLCPVTGENAGRESSAIKLLRLWGRRRGRILLSLIALPAVGSAGIATRDTAAGFEKLPAGFSLTPPPERTSVYSADGQVIAQFYYQNRESVASTRSRRSCRRRSSRSRTTGSTSTAALDIKGTLRALVTNASDGGITQGGSTLTQQYVKNVLVENATYGGRGRGRQGAQLRPQAARAALSRSTSRRSSPRTRSSSATSTSPTSAPARTARGRRAVLLRQGLLGR